MFREDEFGCFTPLSGVFPSVFVQAVWAVVDLTKRGRVSLEGEKKKENQKKKKEEIPKPIDKEKKERKKQPTLSRVTTLTLILDPPLLHLASNNRNWIRHALASLPTGPMSLPPQIHWSPQTQTNVPSDESTLEIEADVDHWQVPIQRQ